MSGQGIEASYLFEPGQPALLGLACRAEKEIADRIRVEEMLGGIEDGYTVDFPEHGIRARLKVLGYDRRGNLRRWFIGRPGKLNSLRLPVQPAYLLDQTREKGQWVPMKNRYFGSIDHGGINRIQATGRPYIVN